jgi:gluconolactonase
MSMPDEVQSLPSTVPMLRGTAGALVAATLPPGAVYPGTPHVYRVYVPSAYEARTPTPFMVFLDGIGLFLDKMAAASVLDELIAGGDVPPLIGIFVDPGVLPAHAGDRQQHRFNRHLEYDAITGRFTRFLLDELVPAVAREYNLSPRPDDRALAGVSSGGVGAFMAAWERPDQFRRVVTFIGTFVDMLGANVLPFWIRKAEPKPLRVFLEETENDNNTLPGSWPLQNQAMSAALAFAGYDHRLVVGAGGHDLEHATACLPAALRWLWQGYPLPVARPTSGPLFDTLLYADEDWEQVGENTFPSAATPAADRHGNVFFAEPAGDRIYRTALDGSVTLFARATAGARALQVGHDDRLYAIQPSFRRIVAFYQGLGPPSVVADNIDGYDLALTAAGGIYVTDRVRRTVLFVAPGGQVTRVSEEAGIGVPGALVLSADQAFLFVADAEDRWVWSFQVEPDGSLVHGQPFFRMEWSEEVNLSRVEAMAVDSLGELYTPTALGIGLSAQTGRSREIISLPERGWISSVAFGGVEGDQLYVPQNGKLFRRRIRRTGATAWRPVKPPVPRL